MREPELFMPTEFLHGLYDGGHGAGLYDYWQMMYRHPRCVGGFLWDLADEGVVRTDRDGMIDNVGNFGADGIVGPHFEKEGSYYTIRQLWCPVWVESDQRGNLTGLRKVADHYELAVENRYDFLNLNTVSFRYEYVALPHCGEKGGEKVLKSATLKGPDVAPRAAGTLAIPTYTGEASMLRITASDINQQELMTWTLAIPYEHKSSFKANGFRADFDAKTGRLNGVEVNGKHISLANGPRFVAARRSDRSLDQFYNHDDKQAEKKKTQYTEFSDAGQFVSLDTLAENRLVARYKLGCMDSVVYKINAEQGIIAIDAHYNFQGVVDLMGVMFDYPEAQVESKQWIGRGPYRVWQNRQHGPQYGLWETAYNDPVPGETFEYPEFKGYFAGVDWMTLRTKEGQISLANLQPDEDYVGVYEPRDGRDHILYTLPQTGLSLMRVIPAVRNKVNTTDLNGPSAQPFWANGSYVARFVLHFE